MADAPDANPVTKKVDTFFAVMEEIEKLEAEVVELKKKKDHLQLDIIETFEAQGMTQMKDTAGRTVFLQEPRFYASINKEKEKEAVQYLKRNLKLGYLFKEQVSSSALGRIVKERLAKGQAVPEEFVTYYAKKIIGYRNAKGVSGND